LEKRKKRAERFGIPLGDEEKLMLRAHRFQDQESDGKGLYSIVIIDVEYEHFKQ
jgi:hypothetical protein